MSATQTHESDTSSGTARWHLDGAFGGEGLLVLGHGAGGGVEAPDLLAARDGAREAGWAVVRVEQPWRVAGRRIAEAPARLDRAWTEVVGEVLARAGTAGRPLVLGGRSAGARVACRTAVALEAAAVLALAFPLQPPGRPDAPSRQGELDVPPVPRLVVQGERDAFGVPGPATGLQVVLVPGADHAFAVRRRDGRSLQEVAEQVSTAVRQWLDGLRR